MRVVGKGSWKEREVGKSKMKLERLKLESSRRSWKVRGEVEKFELKFESSDWSWKVQLKLKSDLRSWKVSIEFGKINRSLEVQLQAFQLKTFQLLVLSNCPFQLHVSLPQRFWQNIRVQFYRKSQNFAKIWVVQGQIIKFYCHFLIYIKRGIWVTLRLSLLTYSCC